MDIENSSAPLNEPKEWDACTVEERQYFIGKLAQLYTKNGLGMAKIEI